MLPLILVDGPLSAFRTHIATTLAERYVSHHDRGRVDTTPEMYVRMMAPAIDSIRPVIIECSWITQEHHQHHLPEISQELFKRHAPQRRMLDRLALGCGALSILVIDESSPLVAHWNDFNSLKFDTLFWTDWDEFFFADIDYRLRQLKNPGPGMGKWSPHESILLVGDQHGDTVQPYNVHRNIAFCSMSGKGCSEWLAEQLDKANISETALYWINARDPKPLSGRATPATFLDELQPKMIIALGDMAMQWCRASEKPFVSVPHPQWWKRFHYYEQYPLIPLLQETTRNFIPNSDFVEIK